MNRVLTIALALLVCWSLASAGVGPVAWQKATTPSTDDTGGPDAYGYTWIDSNEPGGPTYQWIDIAATGELVTGLGDDNWVGPYSVGFPFHYYWYDVDEFTIGSNGYIKFGTPANISQTFPASIPLAAEPNDFIAVYIADWYPGYSGQGQVYYWSNNADSCIVSFINIPAWSTIGSHTFQVIMTDTDSSITFQYGNQSGQVSNNDILIGIECNTGQVGLEHSHDQYISQNNFVVRFEYPDVVTYEVHDMAAHATANPTSEGFFLLSGTEFTPWAVAKNTGNQVETTYNARYGIQQEGGGGVYNQVVAMGPVNPGEEQEITYTPTWTPTTVGQYFMNFTVTLTGDMNSANNLKKAECHVITLPGTMLYDDGSSEQAWSWQGGDGGMGQRFVPPTYPVKIDGIWFYIAGAGGTQPFTAKIFDDDGVNGMPGTQLFSQDVNAPGAGEYPVSTSAQNIIIESGAFYVSWHMNGEGTPAIGLDQSTTQIGSRQSWEYTGVWAPFRQGETDDIMIRCSISEAAAPNHPPEIVDYGPVGLDTVTVDETVDFWASATDPDLDPLTWEWRLDGAVVSTDTTASITFTVVGPHQVVGWVTDGELADSVVWDILVIAGGLSENPTYNPTEFALHPVFPNPFNPTTTITFDLPVSGLIRLVAYDLSGREVAVLMNGWSQQGRHEAVFDASSLSSGIYLLRLEANSSVAAQKVVLMK